MTENLEDIDHTHPETDEPFGASVTYRRGPAPVESTTEAEADASRAVSADGGRADETDTDTLADVSHEAEDVGVQSVYERNEK